MSVLKEAFDGLEKISEKYFSESNNEKEEKKKWYFELCEKREKIKSEEGLLLKKFRNLEKKSKNFKGVLSSSGIPEELKRLKIKKELIELEQEEVNEELMKLTISSSYTLLGENGSGNEVVVKKEKNNFSL